MRARIRLDTPHGLDRRQARRLRRRIARILQVPAGAAPSCIVAGCLWGTPGRGRCVCPTPAAWESR